MQCNGFLLSRRRWIGDEADERPGLSALGSSTKPLLRAAVPKRPPVTRNAFFLRLLQQLVALRSKIP